MTRDEILNMPAGREMDLFIASFVMEDNDAAYRIKILDGINEPRDYVPYYSTDISAAWEVVGKMDKETELHTNCNFKNFPRMSYGCRIVFGNKVYFALAETAPLAICRAALLAVMEDVK